jgi:hypothetical protein
VSENQRAVAWQGGTPVITPITSQEKEAEIREMMIVDEGSIQPEFIAKSALDIPIQHTVAAATFTGNVGEAGDIRGSFSFDVNIHTGAIGNAQTNGKTAGDIAWNLKNGGGEFRADGFNVRNFEGDIMYAPSSSPNPPSNLGMDADNTYLNGIPNGSGITGEFQLKLGTIYPFLSSDEIQMPISGGM